MGQHSSKPVEPGVQTRDEQVDVNRSSRSFGRLRSLSWASRSSFTRNKPARTRTVPEPARRRSLFGTLFKDRRNSVHNESPVIQVSPTSTPEPLVEEPVATQNTTTSRPSNTSTNHSEPMRPQPGTLMIVHGTMPTDDGVAAPPPADSETNSPSDITSPSELNSESPTSSQTLPASDSSTSTTVASDERLQTSIDVLAALLSMATAATATSLLTGTTDILSTLSSDSPSGPQVSPTRARTAWDTLESLFYLRSDRESTISPHIQLFRDLALAVLSSRSSYAPRITPESRAGRTPLPVGSFERFLVDLNANVRLSLREDYGRRGSPGVDVPRRLNWWRAYQFPSVHVQQTSSSTSQEENTPVAGTNAPGSQGSPPGNDESTQNAATATNSGTLVPVVIVGLRSLARDPQHRPSSPSSIPPETTSGAGASGPRTTGQGDPVPTSSSTDEVDAITSSYVIIVLGGHYPPEHRYASATGSDDSNELDMLWDLVELVPFKPRTATAEELSKSGLTCFKGSEMPKMQVAENTAENCLICLEEYADDAEVRLLGCTHAFHRSCVDRWLTEGQNGCPLCRAQGVPR